MVRIIPILLAICLVCSSVYVSADAAEVYDASRVSPAVMQKVMDFLASDATNDTAYNLVTYNCLNFAVDLWHNAYLAGFDTFLIILNEKGIFSHAALGFYAEGGDAHTAVYWAREDGKQWFYVDPQKDGIHLKGNPEDTLDKGNVEIITFIYGEDAFELWREVSGKTLNREMLIYLHKTNLLYKIERFLPWLK